ncbi:MAG: phosphatase [Actinomycetota bacterium]
MTPELRTRLRAHLLASRISGDTGTLRGHCVYNAEALADGDPDKFLGVGARGRDAAGIMRAVAALCGCSESLEERDGPGVIDPDRTLAGLEALGDRLGDAAAAGERLLIVTGHPSGLLPLYQALARALSDKGARLLTPMEDVDLRPPDGRSNRWWFRYFDGVAVLLGGVDLVHTHESWPMDALLDSPEVPDLVLADHGFAGAAATRGFDTACLTDVNDPAIAVAWEDGLIGCAVPLDDNLPPRAYAPLQEYLVGRIAGAGRNG